MAGAVNTIGQSKRGGGDRSSRPAQLQARENEQKALSLWIKGATFQQIAAAGFGIATASGAWRSVGRALARIPKQEADQAREAQLARLQAVRMLLWNHCPGRSGQLRAKRLATDPMPTRRPAASLICRERWAPSGQCHRLIPASVSVFGCHRFGYPV
jgi:hypothetical protein